MRRPSPGLAGHTALPYGDLHGRVLHLRGHTEYAAGHVRRACDLFASAAALLERDAPDAAADALAHATLARWWNADPDGMSAAAGQLRALAKAHPHLVSHADFFTGLTAMFTGHNREGAALIERVLAAEPPDGPGASDGPRSVRRLAGLGWLGRWLRRQGERRSARTELDPALEVFEKYGAAPWAERARGELRATGAVLRSQPQAGLELTAAELRVALLAADGLTDREICGQLYLSPKTVEFHLGRVYRKLGVRGRIELARRLPGREESGSG